MSFNINRYFLIFQMNYVIFLVCFAFIKVETKNCTTIREMNYQKKLISSNYAGPYNMALAHERDILFFCYTVRDIDPNKKYMQTFELAYIDLIANQSETVTGIRGGFATTINSETKDVYMGGEDGIYIYDYDTNRATNMKIINASIWHMFYQDGLYFTTYPKAKLFYYDHGYLMEMVDFEFETEYEALPQVTCFAVKKDSNYIFSNESGLYSYNRTEGKAIQEGNYSLNSFATDKDGNLYFSTSEGLYSVNETMNKIEELVKINDTFGFAIKDYNYMIYSDANNIYRLRPNEKLCGTKSSDSDASEDFKAIIDMYNFSKY